MYTGMFNVTKGSCPYENWTSVARASCVNPDHFHCLRDEDGRIGWVCAEPIWVEKNRCPIFNIVANKLDTSECTKSKCPRYIYRSNKIDVEYACRYTRNSESSTTLAPSPNNSYSADVYILITVLTIILVLAVVLTGIVFYIRRRGFCLNTNRNLGMMEVEANPDESINLFKREDESEHKADESNESFHQAKKILDDHNRILISGVQGSGKTYLAKSLVAELGKEGGKLGDVWISNLTQLREKQNKQIPEEGIFILDEIFYELQTESSVIETVNALQSFLESSVYKTVLITMPSYIWNKHKDMFTQASLDEVHIDLNQRNTSEKRSILRYLMKLYDVSGWKAERICSAERCLLEDPGPKSIGFPALISWLCTTPNKENIETLISNPVSAMSREVKEMKDSRDRHEKGMYLILAYMALHGGVLEVNDIDGNLFDELRRKFESDYETTNLEKDAEMMVINHFLLKNRNDNYEFNLNIMKRIVLISVAEYDADFVQQHCKRDHYLRHMIFE